MVLTMGAALLAAAAVATLGGSRPALGEEPVIQIVYVDADADPGGNGQSWGTAYRCLQDALDEANASSGNRYEFWVAEGVYRPDEDDDGDHVGDAVTETFRISASNVRLYGGFTGDEIALEERDWVANPTVLSGDVGGDDLTDARGVVTATSHISGSNAYHVLWLDGETNEPITGTTVIDGATITAGQADGRGLDQRGGGLYCAGSGDDAECSPTLMHLSFSGNSAVVGGAVYNNGENGLSNPTLVNVSFSGNSAFTGGAMYNDGFSHGTSSPTVVNVTFSGNAAEGGSGGAMYNDGYGGVSNPTLTNVILWGNRADGEGDQMVNAQANPAIGYSLVEGGWDGPGIYNQYGIVTDEGGNIDADPQFVDPEGGNLRPRESSPVIDAGNNDAVPPGVTTDLDGIPRFVDIVTVSDTGHGTPPIVDIGAYEVLGTPDLSLSKSVTPGIAFALQGTVTYTVVLDNSGVASDTNVLLMDTLPGSVSFGDWIEQPAGAMAADGVITWTGTIEAATAITFAYRAEYAHEEFRQVLTNTAEFSGTLQAGRTQASFRLEPPVLYVDGDALGTATGLSWADAYTDVQDALDYAGDRPGNSYEIWVAEGVYTPDAVNETFRVSANNVHLYGGFAAGESAREERDWVANVTVLSGDIDDNDTTDAHGVVVDAADIEGDNARHVLWLDGETNEPVTGRTVIDGFTITGGQADGSGAHDKGGGLYCAGSGSGAECSPTLIHVTFSGNRAEWGGAMVSYGMSGISSPTLRDVSFRGNSAEWGGAMVNYGRGGTSLPTLTNVSFSGNSARLGGAMYNEGREGTCSPALVNVTFSGNSAARGGAMYNDGYGGVSNPTLTNVILWGNWAGREGDQMVNAQANLAIGYSLVEGGWDGPGIYNQDGMVTDEGGNIDADPQFVEPESGDTRLQDTSPAIDAGNNDALPPGVTTDLDGNPRFVDIVTVSDTGHGTAPIVDMGAYEVQGAPDLGLSKAVTPGITFALHGSMTYTVVLENFGVVSDTKVLFTDTLPSAVSFGDWIEQPSGAVVTDDVITWTGTLEPVSAITFAYRAGYACDWYGKVLSNTAEFSGTLQRGQAQAGLTVEPPVLYVDGDATGAATGLLWADAYTTVQDALDYANARPGNSYEIWVAEGVYTPDEDGDGDHVSDAVTETFRISANNVHLYGGFAGGESARAERDWVANVTVLSGDIDDNDTTDARGVVVDLGDINGNNARHVLWLDGETNEPITGSTIIDGFTITAGWGSDTASGLPFTSTRPFDDRSLGGVPRLHSGTTRDMRDELRAALDQRTGGRDDEGGGLYCAGSGSGAGCSPTLAHVTFSGNWAVRGGAMYNGGENGASSPMLTDVVFSNNRAENDGGAMVNDGRGGASHPTLTHVVFSENSARYGGAMYNDGYDGASSPTLTDVSFQANLANWGGAVYGHGESGTSSPALTNVVFSENWAAYEGGAMVNDGEDGTSSPALINVVFSENWAAYDGGAMVNDGSDGGASSPTLINVVFSGNWASDDGGAMVNDGSDGGVSSPTLTNVTLSGNSAQEGGAVHSFGDDGVCSPTLTNVILWGNAASGGGDEMYNQDATPAIGYSLVEGGWNGPGMYNLNSMVTNEGGNIDADPEFVDGGGGNLRLRGTSPAIDAGDNSALPPGVTTDLDGEERFVDVLSVGDTGSGTSPIVDMGAYEARARYAYLPTVFVNAGR
jgi:uncharacterized repeat protein (TIGR01451 family)